MGIDPLVVGQGDPMASAQTLFFVQINNFESRPILQSGFEMIFNMIQQLREGLGFFRTELNRNKGGIVHGQFIRIAYSPLACICLFPCWKLLCIN